MNFFAKMLLLIAMLTIPVLGLYWYSNQQSIGVVKSQIDQANQNRQEHFMNEIEGTLDQLSGYSNVILKDPDFAGLAGGAVPGNRYDYAAFWNRPSASSVYSACPPGG